MVSFAMPPEKERCAAMRVEILSEKEVQVFLMFLDTCSPRNNLMLRLMLQCGLRVGEVSLLNVEDVWRGGYVNPAVHLPRATTKGHKPRFVDIPEPLRLLIGAYVNSLMAKNHDMAPATPLFSGLKINRRLNVSGIGRIVTAASLACLGRRVWPHVLRHTYASTLLRYTNIRVVQELLGHVSVNTTQIYTHVSSEDCKSAVNQAFNH